MLYFIVAYDFDKQHGPKRELFRQLLVGKPAVRLSESAYLLRYAGAVVAAGVWQMLLQEMRPKLDGMKPKLDGRALVEDGDQVWVVPTAGQMIIAGESRRDDTDKVRKSLTTWKVLPLAQPPLPPPA